jgi:hypothetical protein
MVNESKARKKKVKNSYGLKEGRFVHVSEVDSGLACGCVCPISGNALVAKTKELKKVKHFALAAGGDGVSLESFFHRLAKQVLEDDGKITLPASTLYHYNSVDFVVAKESQYDVTEVLTEKRITGTKFVADNIVSIGGKQIVIEWHFSHSCEIEKIQALRKLQIPCVEIDIGELDPAMPLGKLAEWILHDAPRKWIYDSRIQKEQLTKWGFRTKPLRCAEYVRYFKSPNKMWGIREQWVHECPVYEETLTLKECRNCPFLWMTSQDDSSIECAGFSSSRILDKLNTQDPYKKAERPHEWGETISKEEIPKNSIRKWKSRDHVQIIPYTPPPEIDEPF